MAQLIDLCGWLCFQWNCNSPREFLLAEMVLIQKCGIAIVFVLVIFISVDSFRFNIPASMNRGRKSNQQSEIAAAQQQRQLPLVPHFVNRFKASDGYLWLDIFNHLGRERKLFVHSHLDSNVCNQLVASMLWLESQDAKAPITLHISTSGGPLHAGNFLFGLLRMSCYCNNQVWPWWKLCNASAVPWLL